MAGDQRTKSDQGSHAKRSGSLSSVRTPSFSLQLHLTLRFFIFFPASIAIHNSQWRPARVMLPSSTTQKSAKAPPCLTRMKTSPSPFSGEHPWSSGLLCKETRLFLPFFLFLVLQTYTNTSSYAGSRILASSRASSGAAQASALSAKSPIWTSGPSATTRPSFLSTSMNSPRQASQAYPFRKRGEKARRDTTPPPITMPFTSPGN